MTLITAWITPEFRIIASDSRLLNKDGNPIDEQSQKVFASEKLAIGLFGGFDLPFVKFEKEKLLNDTIKKENWDVAKFKVELKPYIDNISSNNTCGNLESNILFIPKLEEPFVMRIHPDKQIEELKLIEYKKLYQLKELDNLFFSEQELQNSEIDFEHQKELLAHFKFLQEKQKIGELDFCELNLPDELQLMIKFYIDATNKKNDRLFRKCIGGEKIFFAYSYHRSKWLIGEYPEAIKHKTHIDLLDEMFNMLKNE